MIDPLMTFGGVVSGPGAVLCKEAGKAGEAKLLADSSEGSALEFEVVNTVNVGQDFGTSHNCLLRNQSTGLMHSGGCCRLAVRRSRRSSVVMNQAAPACSASAR